MRRVWVTNEIFAVTISRQRGMAVGRQGSMACDRSLSVD